MARGIVKAPPMGGSPATTSGKILVTESLADPVDGTPGMDVGTEISFIDANQSKVGDIVDFSLDSTGNGKINSVVASGTVIPNNFPDNIIVAAGQSVIINGTTAFDGKITINGGYLSIVDSAHIEGKIESTNPGSFLLISGDKTVTHDGAIKFTGGNLSIKKANISGKFSSSGAKFIIIQGNTFVGKFEVLNATKCKAGQNSINGDSNPTLPCDPI